jgi:cytochrome P450
VVVVPFAALNCSVSMWGPDAKTFKPSRWFEGDENTRGARDALHGYRHLMTFGDGARMCLGRLFALTEFKVRSCTLRILVPDCSEFGFVPGCAVRPCSKLCV